ncbi:hypothetical protein [Methanolobus sp. WCC5]|uniref:hypothetical protein n=1 Tax=Methanolobus sp. WCC5 TaxID=3125785 RepID=UPI00324AB2E2
MEQLGTWEARVEMMEENIDALEILSHDSDKHWSIIKKWMIKANIDIPEIAPRGLPRHVFDFEGLSKEEMFKTIMKYEILAMNVYKDIKNTNSEVITELFPNEKDAFEFLKEIGQLIKDEEKHANICKQQIGGFAKIKY